MASSYVAWTDITDRGITVFGEAALSAYWSEVDAEIEDVAEQLGVRTTSNIETDPVHRKIVEYGRVYLSKRVCEDRALVNDTEGLSDKYAWKAEYYTKELKRLRPQLSEEMFLGQVDEIRDRANSRVSRIYRG